MHAPAHSFLSPSSLRFRANNSKHCTSWKPMRVQHRMTPLCWGGASAAATPSSKTAGVAQHDDVLLGRSLGESAAAVGSRRLTSCGLGRSCCRRKSLVSCRVSSAMDSACIFSSPQWRWWSFLPPSSFWLSLPFGPSRASELRAVPGRLCRLASRPSVGAENVNLISGTAGDRVAFLLGWSLGGELAQVDAVGHAGGNMWRRRPMVI